MKCPECTRRMKKRLWGFSFYYLCEHCAVVILTSEVENV